VTGTTRHTQAELSLVYLKQRRIVRVTEMGIDTTERFAGVRIIVLGDRLRLRRRAQARGSSADTDASSRTTGQMSVHVSSVQKRRLPEPFFPVASRRASNNPMYNGDQVDFIADTLAYMHDMVLTIEV